ncbi:MULTISPECIES: cyanophycinase [Cyanophyceae]|uniref:cyanophycinase n=1 Tax=Cyanophyceae TaxID=3028117 RepID=UPI001684D55F|nr:MULTISPECIES: cyanophycinase [Cyanophyceae]MBD1915066.1 cyanophycinase [Phormidium sp. FACHB-77]MBD2030812.1 cyanophycinase [Phormidium sp. FACHB-322]MBD2053166.1 cyanophycinase [Leptolyngbya sp. FACHB-60]
MGTEQTIGPLVIIGGAEDKEGDCTILREFVRIAGGIKAHIAVMTAATSLPGEVGAEYIRVFERIGAQSVEVVNTERREDSDREDNLKKIASATGIFFTGGDQSRIVDFIKDTPLDAAIRQRRQEGAVIGGTSAGAAMMPDEMIVGGSSVSNPSMDAVEMGPGMGFLPGIVVDQHFAQRGRLGRLLSALALQPAVLGLGIDENTSIVVTGDEFEVVGEGSITVVDETTATHNNLEGVLKDEPIALWGVKLHILPHGYRFNLKTHTPLV